MSHGTRTHYQRAGCRCVPCRAANASYQAVLRHRKAKGLPVLAALIPAGDAARRIRALLTERWSKRQLVIRAGLERHTLRLTPQDRVRLRTVLKIRRVYRILLPIEDNLKQSKEESSGSRR